jgi:hypothetical protein
MALSFQLQEYAVPKHQHPAFRQLNKQALRRGPVWRLALHDYGLSMICLDADRFQRDPQGSGKFFASGWF